MVNRIARRVIAVLEPDNLDYMIRATEVDEASGFDPVRMYGRTFNSIINEAIRSYRDRLAFGVPKRGRRHAA